MRFSHDEFTIEDTIDDEELRNAWRKRIEQSPEWKEHEKKHSDAKIVEVDVHDAPEEKKPEQHAHGPGRSLYDAQTGKFPTGSCTCGQLFEMHSDSGHAYQVGNKSENPSVYEKPGGEGSVYEKKDDGPASSSIYQNKPSQGGVYKR